MPIECYLKYSDSPAREHVRTVQPRAVRKVLVDFSPESPLTIVVHGAEDDIGGWVYGVPLGEKETAMTADMLRNGKLGAISTHGVFTRKILTADSRKANLICEHQSGLYPVPGQEASQEQPEPSLRP